MDAVQEAYDIWKIVSALRPFITPFVSVTASALVAQWVAKKQIRVSAVSATRREWIITFRNDVAEYVASVNDVLTTIQRVISMPPRITESRREDAKEITRELTVIFHKLNVIETRIKLWLDLQDPNHLKLGEVMIAIAGEAIKLIQDLHTPLDESSKATIQDLAGGFTSLSHSILKQEWEKVQRAK